MNRKHFLFAALIVAAPAHAVEKTMKFSFGHEAPGAVPVAADSVYKAENGYGFLGAPSLKAQNNSLVGDGAFIFAAKLPEGNYDVTLRLAGNGETTVKAEARRLMLEKIPAGQTRTFTVNVRCPQIDGNSRVALNTRENDSFTWDDKLTLEFGGAQPGVSTLEIKKNESAVTLYIAGDSTVTDQQGEPYAAWGQMLPRFFKPGVAVANHAESGRALYSFRGERRLAKILGTIKAGDYLFIQFGHNDQKDKTPGSGPFTSYKNNLKSYVAQAREKGAIPVIVTPMERRRWDAEGKPQQTLTDFAQAARDAAREDTVPLIDLHAMSLKFYGALGPDNSKKAFVHYPAGTFPGQSEALKDDTHFNAYGAYQLAKCIAEGIKENKLGLTQFLLGDTPAFDPSKPDDVNAWSLPVSPKLIIEKPAGN